LHAAGHDLERVAALAVLFPRAGAQAAFDGDAPALVEVLGAQLRLTLPGADPHEVGAGLAAAAVDGKEEFRDLLVVAQLFELDLGREIPDEGDAVHAAKVDGKA